MSAPAQPDRAGAGAPVLVWLRRELRLADHPALLAAAGSGRPVIPVFLYEESAQSLGAAAKLRLELGLAAFARALEDLGSRLILRRSPAAEGLAALIAETGARAIYWSRSYEPAEVARDKALKADLAARGYEVRSFPGRLLFEPWEVLSGQGTPYQVFTPYWRVLSGRDPGAPLPAPGRLPAPERWPASDRLADWRLGAAMRRGRDGVAAHARVGEAAARDRLAGFVAGGLAGYGESRDMLGQDAVSGLSEPLTWGEISPRQIWAAASRAGPFLRQLAWRDFAWQLVWHFPHMLHDNWRAGWEDFPWSEDRGGPGFAAWSRAMTGIPLVDAGLRELWVTGRMHNRARMVVASYLTKHLLLHWRLGAAAFAERLTDWDAASNAMGWQWVAGCGPDAAPYFRIFNPLTQADKFDSDGSYRRRWLAPDSGYFEMVPERWGLSPEAPYPAPVVSHEAGRARALAAYQVHRG